MPNLSNDKDVKNTQSQGEGNSSFLKLEEGHNFILILNPEYSEGYTHWVKAAGETYKRTCKAGLEYKGWDPDNCPLCALTLEQYDLKKEAKESGDKKLAEEYNDRGNNLRSGYFAYFKAVKFGVITERKKVKGKDKTVKVSVPDFEEINVGKLRLTYSQTNKLFDLVRSDECEEINEGPDLLEYVIDFVKIKEGNKRYAEVKEIKIFGETEEMELGEDELPNVSNIKDFPEEDDLEDIADIYRNTNSEIEEDEEYYEEELEVPKSPKKVVTKKKKTAKKKSTAKKPEDDEF